MKTKISRMIFGLAAAGCAVGMALPPRASAEVSDADFNALKETVQKLSEKVQSLQQTNVIEQQTHAGDMQQIQQLQQKLAETQLIATNTAAALAQPLPRQPIDEATVNHNFMMLGDAEFQYDKIAGQHGTFLLADFAPIFL